MFAEAIRHYHHYTQNQSVLDILVPWASLGKILAAMAVLGCGYLLGRVRGEPGNVVAFGRATALVMALTVLVVPMYAPYNQVLLLPAILVLVRDRAFFTSRSRAFRLGYLAGAFALAWQWIATLALSAAYLFGSRALALRGWWLPGVATFSLPVLIFVMTLLDVQGSQLSGSALPRERRAG
jgi:hypothetical protein